MRGSFSLLLENTRFKPVIFQIETIKVINIFASSFSPFVNFCEVIRFLIQFSHSVVSDSLQPHGLQHARLPCPSSTPRACSNSCPSGWWCHPTISSSVIPFSSCLQSFAAIQVFNFYQNVFVVFSVQIILNLLFNILLFLFYFK